MQPRAADHNQASAEHKNDADMHFYVLWQTPCMTPFSFQMRMHPLSIELEPYFVDWSLIRIFNLVDPAPDPDTDPEVPLSF